MAQNISLGLTKSCLIQKPDFLLPFIKTRLSFTRQHYDCYLGRLQEGAFFLFCVAFTKYLSVKNSYILLQDPAVLLLNRH